MKEILKVLAYITYGKKLLVFKHMDYPEAGIQVPAGTVELGETIEAAALRESQEETGLHHLQVVGFLGASKRDMRDYGIEAIYHRHFYHLQCEESPPQSWQHGEFNPSDGSEEIIYFDFYWVDLPNDVPELSGDQGDMLPELIKRIEL